MGTLVERPKSTLEKEILSYYVFTRDGLILATGQLKRYEGGFAEIGCLVVSSEYRRGGRGDAMLGYLERLSLQCGATKVFVLSTQTMEWFVERGFREVPVEVSKNVQMMRFLIDFVLNLTSFFRFWSCIYYRACHQVDKLYITRNERVKYT
jgi:N-acetylglutamate synthase-like GNAT family acetyltransferase